MFYTYILESASASGTYYHGHTTDLRQRLHEHNTGRCSHTAKHLPWKLKFYAAFETLPLAQHFERYLKSGSSFFALIFAQRAFAAAEMAERPASLICLALGAAAPVGGGTSPVRT